MFDVIPSNEQAVEMDIAVLEFLRAMRIECHVENGILRFYTEADMKNGKNLLSMLKVWIDNLDIVYDDWSDKWK